MPSENPKLPGGLARKSIKGVLWTSVGATGQSLAQLAVLVVLGRLLTPADFGLAAAVTLVSGFVAIFIQLGVASSLVQRPTLEERHIRTAFTVCCIMSVAIGLAFYASAGLIAATFRLPEMIPLVQLLALLFPLYGAQIVPVSLMQRGMRFKELGLIQGSTFILGYCVVGVCLALAGWGAYALVVAHMVQMIAKTGLLVVMAPHSRKPQFDLAAFREIAHYGGGVMLGRIGNYTALQGDNFVIAHMLGPAALGLYGRAYQITAMPASLFSKVVDTVLFPTLALIQSDAARIKASFRRGSAAVAFLTLPASAALFVLAPELTLVLLGRNWLEMIPCLQILSISMFCRTSYKMSDSLARATGAVYQRAWRQWIYALSVLVGAWGGARWGITGAAIGVGIAIIANFISMTSLSLRVIGMTWGEYAAAHLPPALLAVVVGSVSFLSAELLRGVTHFSIVFIGSVTASLLAVAAVAFSRLAPLFLGEDGLWAKGLLMGFVQRRKIRTGRPDPSC